MNPMRQIPSLQVIAFRHQGVRAILMKKKMIEKRQVYYHDNIEAIDVNMSFKRKSWKGETTGNNEIVINYKVGLQTCYTCNRVFFANVPDTMPE